MNALLDIAFFGSSLVSAYWNGAATYYRGIIRALAERGHRITFYEPDAFERQQHRDLPDPDWARVVVYSADGTDEVERCLEQAHGADVVVKASGVGVFDEFLEREVLSLRNASTLVLFWDVDAPATLQRLEGDLNDPFHALVPKYDLILTYGGGPPVVEAYSAVGAADCIPIYNALDPQTHYPVPPAAEFEGTLAFLGNRLPDRERRVAEFFFKAAELVHEERFLLGGNGWHQNVPDLKNVEYLGHIYTHQHNAFNSTPTAVLNISRESMARMGYSPATRVFEAAGAAACIITDAWEGIEQFLEPGREILVAQTGEDVARILFELTNGAAKQVGEWARQRVLREHTYWHRAKQVEAVLTGNHSKRLHMQGNGTATRTSVVGSPFSP